MHINIVKAGAGHRGFDDVILPLYYALSRLGHKVEITRNTYPARCLNIIFGAHEGKEFPFESVPADSIIYNLEQVVQGGNAMREHYFEALDRFTVWDYSLRNVGVLKAAGMKNVNHVPFGYVPEMTRLDPDYPKDIDVLMYGVFNERRLAVLEELCRRGIKAVGRDKLFGADRDFLIARSKVVLNVHYYLPGILEVIRLGYLLANQKLVVSERNDDTHMPEEFADTCIFCPYAKLADSVTMLLHKEELCRKQARRGFELFSAQAYADTLRRVLGRPMHAVGAPQAAVDPAARDAVASPGAPAPGFAELPVKLNAGSGKTFKLDYLNIDISPKWNPDLVLDLGAPLDSAAEHHTRRFGAVRLVPGHFERIDAHDVIEHIPDVALAMRNFLDLLKEGGELHINVPYDLSLGAWQDPTHVRAFNENSWLYYTDWAWYLGWREHRFAVKDIKYILSPWGQQLAEEGRAVEELLRTARAVEFMSLVLSKRKATEAEREECDRRRRAYYKDAVGEWRA